MIKHSEPDRKKGLGGLTQKSVTNAVSNQADFLHHFDKDWDNGPSGIGLSFIEGYLEGRLDIALIFPGTNIAAICPALRSGTGVLNDELSVFMPTDINGSIASHTRDHRLKLGRVHFGGGDGGNNQFVLVSNIEGVQRTKPFVPTWIRLEPLNFIDDLFTGQMCFSIRKRIFKSISPPAKRKLDTFRLDGLITNHRKYHDVESATQVVDSIPDDEWDRAWEGNFLFDEMGFFSGVGFANRLEPERFLQKINFDYSVEVIDVMLCPRNL